MKKFKSFLQLDELMGVAPKAKGEHKFVHATYLGQIKDPGDLEKVGPEEIGPHDTKMGSGKRKLDRLDNKQKFGESVDLEDEQIDERNKENADRRKMMDAERGAKFKAQGHPTPGPTSKQKDDKSHSKMIGRAIRKMSNEESELEGSELDEASYTGKGNHRPGWMLRADPELAKKFKEKEDTAKKRQAAYGNPAAGKSVKEESELEEANFSKVQTTMAHTIGKYFKKKGVGDESKGGPYAVASAMVRDKPSSAKKAYATIKAKMKNEDHQDMLMALYDSLNEDNQEMFESMIETDPEKLLAFAESVLLTKE